MLDKILGRLTRSLVPSLFVVTYGMSGVQPAFSHDEAATAAASNPQVFKTVPTGTPTDSPGKNRHFLCFDELNQLNGGLARIIHEHDDFGLANVA